MKKVILLTVFSILLVFVSVVSAGQNQKAKNNSSDIKQNKKQINSSMVAFNNLSLAIDFWHDASLKGNQKAVAEHNQMIIAIIAEDIKESQKSVSYAKLEASYPQEASHNKNDIKNDESVLNTKKLLLSSIKKSKSFGYSYRLLADYQQLLQKDIDADKIELAEDISDKNDDAGKVRFIR